jgi:hypothetical protein
VSVPAEVASADAAGGLPSAATNTPRSQITCDRATLGLVLSCGRGPGFFFFATQCGPAALGLDSSGASARHAARPVGQHDLSATGPNLP